MRNEKDIWTYVKSEWMKIITSVDSKLSESKEYDKKEQDKLSIHTILIDKLSEMRNVISLPDTIDKTLSFSPWNIYFSSPTSPSFLEELNTNLTKLLALSNSVAPSYQSFERALNFQKDLEHNMSKFTGIVTEAN